ncbi:hypothetical protein IG631_12126 [Alternaria alternata]|nr:hypothetical protein IG631_12126 [Alternaria alternata]
MSRTLSIAALKASASPITIRRTTCSSTVARSVCYTTPRVLAGQQGQRTIITAVRDLRITGL